MVPGRCRLSRRGVSDVPVLRLPVSGLGRGARTPCPQPPEPASAPWPSSRPPPRRGRVRRSLRVSPEAGRRGGISSPAGQSAARSHARVRGTPRTGPPPGAMAAESHRRGRRPVPGPDRSATGQAPEGRPGIAAEAPRTGAVRKHKIGTLSRSERSWTSRRAGASAGPLSRAGEGQGEGSGLSGRGSTRTRGDGPPDPETSCPSPQPSPARERGHGAGLGSGLGCDPRSAPGQSARRRRLAKKPSRPPRAPGISGRWHGRVRRSPQSSISAAAPPTSSGRTGTRA